MRSRHWIDERRVSTAHVVKYLATETKDLRLDIRVYIYSIFGYVGYIVWLTWHFDLIWKMYYFSTYLFLVPIRIEAFFNDTLKWLDFFLLFDFFLFGGKPLKSMHRTRLRSCVTNSSCTYIVVSKKNESNRQSGSNCDW